MTAWKAQRREASGSGLARLSLDFTILFSTAIKPPWFTVRRSLPIGFPQAFAYTRPSLLRWKTVADWYGSPSRSSGPIGGPGLSTTFSEGTLPGPSGSFFPLSGTRTVLFERWTYACGSSPMGTSGSSASARTSVGISVVAASGGASCFGRLPMMDSTLNHSAVARRQSFWWSARAGRREWHVQFVYIDAEVIPVRDLVCPTRPKGPVPTIRPLRCSADTWAFYQDESHSPHQLLPDKSDFGMVYEK
jgi:hypothetical protein